MTKQGAPTLPTSLEHFFREQLYRELSHMFKWEGLPSTIPHDYLERNLIRHGIVLFYYDENIGLDVLRAEVTGYNRHNYPTSARTFTPTTLGEVQSQITRNIKRLSDGNNAVELFNPKTDGVLINNMEHGQSCVSIVEHFAHRLALAQQSFDTQLLWTNIPYIFQTSDQDTRLSIEKMFTQIFEGKSHIIVDKNLFVDNRDRTGVPTNIKYLGKEIMDTQNEIMMKFREMVGIETTGVEKAERVNTLEVRSNYQHTQTVLEIMKSQREIACDNINAFFGTAISVHVIGEELTAGLGDQRGGVEDDNGDGDSGTEGTSEE